MIIVGLLKVKIQSNQTYNKTVNTLYIRRHISVTVWW